MKPLYLSLTSLCLLVFFSCNKEKGALPDGTTLGYTSDETFLRKVLAETGFDPHQIEIDIENDAVIVEGDGYWPYQELLDGLKVRMSQTSEDGRPAASSQSGKSGNAEAVSSWHVLSTSKVKDLKVYIAPSLPAAKHATWNNGLIKAIDAINKVPNCAIHFSLVSSPWSANIVAASDDDASTLPFPMRNLKKTTFAQAGLPLFGYAGRYVSVNTDLNPMDYSFDTLNFTTGVMMHELLHTVGLVHTGSNEDWNVPFTYTNVISQTVMHAYAVNPFSAPTTIDETAMRVLYPETLVAPNIINVAKKGAEVTVSTDVLYPYQNICFQVKYNNNPLPWSNGLTVCSHEAVGVSTPGGQVTQKLHFLGLSDFEIRCKATNWGGDVSSGYGSWHHVKVE